MSEPFGGGGDAAPTPLHVDHQAVIDLTRALVRIPSTSDRGEAEAAQLVAETMRRLGWEPMVLEVAPGRPNVICRIQGARPGKTLLFEGHTDVVTPGDRSEWTHDPFGAVVEDGRIHGRGAADMKGGVAAMIYAAHALVKAGPFDGTILLAVLCDEEEAMIGVHHFVNRGFADGVDGAIVCEPEGGEVCAKQKGALRLRIELTGKMAHGAMPQHGRNPIQALGRLLALVSDYERELRLVHGRDPHLGEPYLTPTVASAGSLPQLNVIPATAVVALDIRTLPSMDHDEVRERFGRMLERVEQETGVTGEIEVLVDRCATETPESDPVVQAVVKAHTEVTGRRPPFGGVPGTTDGTILWSEAGIPVVVYGPGGKWIAHQADEYVEIEDLTRSADVYARAALNFLGSGA